MLDTPGVPKPPEGNWGWIGWIFAGIIAGIQALFHRRGRKATEEDDSEQLTDTLDRVFALEDKGRTQDDRLGHLERTFEDRMAQFDTKNRIQDDNLARLRDAVENMKRDMVTKDDLRDFGHRLLQELRPRI